MSSKNSEMQRVIEALEAIREKQAAHTTELAVYNTHLEEHMARTKLAEEGLKVLAGELKPVQRHVHNVEGAMKLLGVLSLVAGIYKIFLA